MTDALPAPYGCEHGHDPVRGVGDTCWYCSTPIGKGERSAAYANPQTTGSAASYNHTQPGALTEPTHTD